MKGNPKHEKYFMFRDEKAPEPSGNARMFNVLFERNKLVTRCQLLVFRRKDLCDAKLGYE